jgi:hypothetical protein
MVRQHPKDASEDSLTRFASLVTQANRRGAEAVFVLPSSRTVRVKRAARVANQVHALWCEALVLHIPASTSPERWYVVPPRWQLAHALSGNAKPHHALHPVECMQIELNDLDPAHEVHNAGDLLARCEVAASESNDSALLDAVADAKAAEAEYNQAIDGALDRLRASLESTRSKL